MEACGTAHFWGRTAESYGRSVVLLPPHAVRRHLLRNKTDRADARARLQALRNDGLCTVPIKTVDQHVLAALHRMRSSWMAARTVRLNTVRSLLRELGRISRRGDPCLRMLLVHGARSVLAHAKRSNAPRDGLRAWALARETARGHNEAAVALANKLARIVWAVWRNEEPFQLRNECGVP